MNHYLDDSSWQRVLDGCDILQFEDSSIPEKLSKLKKDSSFSGIEVELAFVVASNQCFRYAYSNIYRDICLGRRQKRASPNKLAIN